MASRMPLMLCTLLCFHVFAVGLLILCRKQRILSVGKAKQSITTEWLVVGWLVALSVPGFELILVHAINARLIGHMLMPA